MNELEQQVAEALLALPIPRRTHSVEVVKNILAPRVAAAITRAITVAQERTSTPFEPSCLNLPEDAEAAALYALRGLGETPQ
jgi:hypothetical protein